MVALAEAVLGQDCGVLPCEVATGNSGREHGVRLRRRLHPLPPFYYIFDVFFGGNTMAALLQRLKHSYVTYIYEGLELRKSRRVDPNESLDKMFRPLSSLVKKV